MDGGGRATPSFEESTPLSIRCRRSFAERGDSRHSTSFRCFLSWGRVSSLARSWASVDSSAILALAVAEVLVVAGSSCCAALVLAAMVSLETSSSSVGHHGHHLASMMPLSLFPVF